MRNLIPASLQRGSTDDQVEQLAEDDPDPRGEHRESENAGGFGWIFSYMSGTGQHTDDAVATEAALAPDTIKENWQEYYKEFPLTRAPLKLFDDAVIEPGYRIRVEDTNGDRDDEMEEALKLWASNCVIHAGETNQDLSVLLEQIPSQRRGKGTVFVEKVGTRSDQDALAVLMLLDPSTMKIFKRDNQTILVQPDDDVAENHPTTPSGDAAAYVQYHIDLAGHDDKEPIAFSKDDIVKLVYDADTGEAWGSSIFEALDDVIDSLQQKLDDRDYAIRMVGYAHRIYKGEWSQDEAKEFAKDHRKGDMSSQYGPDDEDQQSFAGRVDFVPEGTVEVQVEEGSVPDISDAIMDDIQQIFSIMPVSRFKIAYEEGINQFVVEPQQAKDDRQVDKERRRIERKFEPIFEEKADELADGSYDGTVHFSIESPEDENPIRRESFPAENLQSFVEAWQAYQDGNVEMHIPPEAFAEMIGFDLEEYQEKYDWNADPLEISDEDDTTEAMPGGDGGGEESDEDDQDDGDGGDGGDDE